MHTIPIDFDKPMYSRAVEAVGGSEESLFEAYFDAQYEMLRELKPAVVGHFDLIRLFCDDPEKQLRDYGNGVWERVERNVDFVLSYGGLTELNSASIRKGWNEPYPRRDLCEVSILAHYLITNREPDLLTHFAYIVHHFKGWQVHFIRRQSCC